MNNINLIFLIPFLAYIVAGCCKFLTNTILNRKINFRNIGMGGFPSTHNTITSTTTSAVSVIEGIDSSEFLICLTFSLIILIDSLDLRNKISSHAKNINTINKNNDLREKIGHKPIEVFGGIFLGIFLGPMLLMTLT